mmetsp:Transcript_13289/g.32520  ORF Transcript_13289/g.32520 Transcript_13289/m.32520 type:complete len:277 (+) Transcript_13289:4720-5550(+)
MEGGLLRPSVLGAAAGSTDAEAVCIPIFSARGTLTCCAVGGTTSRTSGGFNAPAGVGKTTKSPPPADRPGDVAASAIISPFCGGSKTLGATCSCRRTRPDVWRSKALVLLILPMPDGRRKYSLSGTAKFGGSGMSSYGGAAGRVTSLDAPNTAPVRPRGSFIFEPILLRGRNNSSSSCFSNSSIMRGSLLDRESKMPDASPSRWRRRREASRGRCRAAGLLWARRSDQAVSPYRCPSHPSIVSLACESKLPQYQTKRRTSHCGSYVDVIRMEIKAV